ncbi:MAG: M48 family metallopeptidase [Candidatus Nanopelagicaceae bacterium]
MVDGSVDKLVNSLIDDVIEQTLPGIDEGEIVVIRSKKRKRNIAAFRQGGKIIISIPARLSKAEERQVVPEMIAKIRAKEVAPAESELMEAAEQLLSRYAPEITLRPASVAWRPMNERWGSCTSVDRTIRLASKLQRAPEYVLEFVLYHEAIHLQHADHGPEFYEFLHRYPRHLEAEAFLAGFELAENN